jgi:hypothetical protein
MEDIIFILFLFYIISIRNTYSIINSIVSNRSQVNLAVLFYLASSQVFYVLVSEIESLNTEKARLETTLAIA